MTDEIKKKKILHVDDEEDTLIVVKAMLERESYDVTSVLSGSEALKKINLNGFSLIILDIMMPDMSGWELFTRISQVKPNYKVVFLSILDVSEEKMRELKGAGIKDYIKKPFDRKDFITRIKKVLKD